MKQEQKLSTHYTNKPEEILFTPIHLKMQKQTNLVSYFQYDNALKYMKNSMSEHIQINESNNNKKFQFVNLLLYALGYSKSARIFQREAMEENSCRNPQISSKKKQKREINKITLNSKIEQILSENLDFTEMLDQLLVSLKQEQQQIMIEEIDDQKQNLNTLNHCNLQKAIQNLFPKIQTITLPIYQSLQIDIGSKQIKFADINQSQDLCILDSQNTVSVIQQTNRQKISRTLLEQNLHVIDMKWANSQIFILLTSNNKILLFNTKMINIRSFKSHKMTINTHEICVIENNPNSQSIYVLTANKHLFFPFKINLNGQNIVEENLPSFQIEHQLSGITTMKVSHKVRFHRSLNKTSQQTQFNVVTEIQHFYGLTDKMRKIIKFDSIVQKSGVIWQCPDRQFVSEMKTSDCGHFLQLLTVTSQNGFLDTCKVERVSFIKMSASGSILQKLDMSLQKICKDVFLRYKFVYGRLHSLNKNMKWLKLNPYWIRCFTNNNNIYYVSMKTGNMLFSQQIEKKQIKLLCTGKQNALLYQTDGKLILISTKDQPKNNLTLQNRRNPDLRESLIQRFSRIHGIPQNLLLLLRTIRNNEIELEEISE